MSTSLSRPLRALFAALALTAMVAAFTGLLAPAQASQTPHVTLKASAHTISTAGKVTLKATSAHRTAGSEVTLEQKKAGRWAEVSAFPRAGGGRITKSHLAKGVVRYRAVLEYQGTVLDVSPVVVIHVKAPVKHTSHAAPPASHACTRTSTGSCIAGGQFCKQSMYGQIGYDASGNSWKCTGDRTHPHWM